MRPPIQQHREHMMMMMMMMQPPHSPFQSPSVEYDDEDHFLTSVQETFISPDLPSSDEELVELSADEVAELIKPPPPPREHGLASTVLIGEDFALDDIQAELRGLTGAPISWNLDEW